MAAFRRAGDEWVNVFEVDETHLFKHYFDGEAMFDRLKQYYNNQQYRSEYLVANSMTSAHFWLSAGMD